MDGSGSQTPLRSGGASWAFGGYFETPNDNAGSHRKGPSTVYALLYTVIPSVALAVVLLGIFFPLRKKLRRLYAPRTYIDVLTDKEKTPPDPDSTFAWVRNFIKFNDIQILNWQSLDAYLYVRFFKVIVLTFLVGFVLVGAILLPINATGGGGQKQLDMLSFSNVKDPSRYWAHAVVAWLFFGFVIFMITRETIFLINLRQAYLLSPWNSSRMSSRTVLFTSVPHQYCSEERIKPLFNEVKQVWLVEDFKKLEDLIEKMDKTALKLEVAEIKLMKNANAKRLKEKDPDRHPPEHWLALSRRPKHRHDKLDFIYGNRFDTIDHCREELRKQVPEVRSQQKLRLDGDAKLLGAVFVEFESQAAAQAAFCMVAYNHPERIVPRQVGVLPEEVIWRNLRMSEWEVMVRKLAATAFVCMMIIFWGVPVAFVGSISNLNYLSQKFKWLKWLDSLNKKELGLLTGLLPALLLSILTSVVPMFCRYIARQSGAVTQSQIELRTQKFFFAFSLIQVFLITTFSSGITAMVGQIARDPSMAPTILAENLPKASNFYMSYFVLYGVAISAVSVFNPQGLFWGVIFPKIWPYSSPRDAFIQYTTLATPGYGSECAKWTNLAVIAISYSCIAPLVLGFATIGFGFIYLAFRYNFFYVFDTDIDTKGAFYAQALQQLTVGIYIAELCLIGLFSTRVKSAAAANGPLILTILLFLCTVLYQYLMRQTLTPLTELLPRNLLTETEQDYNDALSAAENGSGTSNTDREQRQPLLAPERTTSDADEPAAAARLNKIDSYGVDDKRKRLKTRLRRFFAPHTQSTASIAASLDPSLQQPVPPYPADIARTAFINPAITREPPVIWIVKDEMGISDQEVRETKSAVEGVEVTNRGAWLDAKNRVVWDEGKVKEMPLWKGKVVY